MPLIPIVSFIPGGEVLLPGLTMGNAATCFLAYYIEQERRLERRRNRQRTN